MRRYGHSWCCCVLSWTHCTFVIQLRREELLDGGIVRLGAMALHDSPAGACCTMKDYGWSRCRWCDNLFPRLGDCVGVLKDATLLAETQQIQAEMKSAMEQYRSLAA